MFGRRRDPFAILGFQLYYSYGTVQEVQLSVRLSATLSYANPAGDILHAFSSNLHQQSRRRLCGRRASCQSRHPSDPLSKRVRVVLQVHFAVQ